MYNSLYLLNVIEDGKTFPYPYSDLKHAEEHFDWERVSCVLLEYINGEYHMIKAK
jgi:acetylornithine/succinyldiaminopimelate/putrescine aminotransferase